MSHELFGSTAVADVSGYFMQRDSAALQLKTICLAPSRGPGSWLPDGGECSTGAILADTRDFQDGYFNSWSDGLTPFLPLPKPKNVGLKSPTYSTLLLAGAFSSSPRPQ